MADETKQKAIKRLGTSDLQKQAYILANGVSFGFFDEAAATVAHFVDVARNKMNSDHTPLSYEEYAKFIRDEMDDYRTANPIKAVTLDAAGSMIIPAAIAIASGGSSLVAQSAIKATQLTSIAAEATVASEVAITAATAAAKSPQFMKTVGNLVTQGITRTAGDTNILGNDNATIDLARNAAINAGGNLVGAGFGATFNAVKGANLYKSMLQKVDEVALEKIKNSAKFASKTVEERAKILKDDIVAKREIADKVADIYLDKAKNIATSSEKLAITSAKEAKDIVNQNIAKEAKLKMEVARAAANKTGVDDFANFVKDASESQAKLELEYGSNKVSKDAIDILNEHMSLPEVVSNPELTSFKQKIVEAITDPKASLMTIRDLKNQAYEQAKVNGGDVKRSFNKLNGVFDKMEESMTNGESKIANAKYTQVKNGNLQKVIKSDAELNASTEAKNIGENASQRAVDNTEQSLSQIKDIPENTALSNKNIDEHKNVLNKEKDLETQKILNVEADKNAELVRINAPRPVPMKKIDMADENSTYLDKIKLGLDAGVSTLASPITQTVVDKGVAAYSRDSARFGTTPHAEPKTQSFDDIKKEAESLGLTVEEYESAMKN